jgi:hypothetical protein
LLLQQWAQAASHYREALDSRHINHFARESMRRQVERIILAFRDLGVAVSPPFEDLTALFGAGPAPAGIPVT